MDQASLHHLLSALPSVEEVLNTSALLSLRASLPQHILTLCARDAIERARQEIRKGTRHEEELLSIASRAQTQALAYLRPSMKRVINATGVVIHTNLGRSPLALDAINAVVDIAQGYSTLEYSTQTQSRGSRHDHVEQLLCTLSGAQAALVVNNNAAAVLMVLSEYAAGFEAIVSRGELVEIGGEFRIPDIMVLSQATMVEVGTTNKTHEADYTRALTSHTALLLKVHRSNFRMLGFTGSVSVAQLRALANAENHRREVSGECTSHVLVYEDLGSGALLNLPCFGDYDEPTVVASLQAGADLVSFSGDKLLGGPQAGIIVGNRDLIERLKKHPLARAIRIDKMTLAALEATLRLYLNPHVALTSIPTLRMLTEKIEDIYARAQALATILDHELPPHCARIEVIAETGRAGGGALPQCNIETAAVALTFIVGSAQGAEHYLIAKHSTPIIGRIKKDCLLFDALTLTSSDFSEIAAGLGAYFAEQNNEAQSGQTQGRHHG